MRRRESRRRSRHNRTSKSPAMWPGFLAAQIVREYSLLLIFLCKIFPEKLDKARGGRRGILDSPFQSTPPARGGDGVINDHLGGGDFNPRPPRGGRRVPFYLQKVQGYFNPRPPRGGATKCKIADLHRYEISIHAPREGGDMAVCSNSLSVCPFQSTPPARGATAIIARTTQQIPKFQSTPPARGATAKMHSFTCGSLTNK